VSLKLLAALALSVAAQAAAQDRTVKIQVPFAPGGGTDILTRIIAPKLAERLAQPVIVENRPGAGSMLAPEVMLKSPADGYTLVVSNVTIAMPSMFKKLPFDVRKDIAPVSLIGFGQVALCAHPSLPAKTVKDVVALARRKPGTLNYGSAGTGAFTHLAMALFESMAGISMVHIPYKGSSQAVIGVTTGEVDLAFSSPAAAIGLVKQGRLRFLAVSGSNPSTLAPGVPTMSEAGVKGYEATSWYGLLAPAAAPRAAITKLSEESVKALTAPDMKERLLAQAVDPAKGGIEEFTKLFAAEVPKWEKVITAAKIPPQ